MKKRARAYFFSYNMGIKRTTANAVTPEETTTPKEVESDGFLPEESTATPEESLPEGGESEANTPSEVLPTENAQAQVTPPSFTPTSAIIRGQDQVTAIQNTAVAASTSEQLMNGEFVMRYYPLFESEEPGTKACVTINGVPYWFEKGKEIKIPAAVAAVYDITVARKMNGGSERSRAMLANRPDFINAFN